MKKTVCILLLLTVCVSATWAIDNTESDTSARSPFRLMVEGALSPGLDSYSQRGMQAAVVGGITMGNYLTAYVGFGVRHTYTLVSIDNNIHGYGETSQRTYGNRFTLPLFLRLKGIVPAGRFAWAGATLTPFAQFDIGYAVDIQPRQTASAANALHRTASGPFVLPAAGLDATLQSGARWTLCLGLGWHVGQYLVIDHAAEGTTEVASGNALSLNISLSYHLK